MGETVRPMGRLEGWGRALLTTLKRPGPVRALPPVTLVRSQVQIESEHLRRYRELCGFQTGDGVPITYPQLLTFPLLLRYMTSPACPWPAMGTVHLANAITQHGAIRLDDPLRVELSTGDCLAHDKGQVFTLHLRASHAESGRSLWQATQTLLRLGVTHPQGPIWTDPLDRPMGTAELGGLALGGFDAPVDIGRRYARVSQDANPIHLWPLTARLLGFKSALAHGLWTQARALALLHRDGGPTSAHLQATFKRPLFLPAHATLWLSGSTGTLADVFEVRDAAGQVPHLRAKLTVIQTGADPS